MEYLYGQMVTPTEKAFLTQVLNESTKLEKVKHLRAIQYTMKREGLSIIESSNALDRNKQYAEELNKKHFTKRFVVNKFGEISEMVRDKYGSELVKKLEKRDFDILEGKPIKQEGRFSKFFKKAKTVFGYIKEAFTVY